MRLKALKFEGFSAGATDFAVLLSQSPDELRLELADVTSSVAGQLVAPHPDQFFSLIVVGHADRQDQSDMNCDQRRASETDAATGRAVSAWEWMKADVTAKAAAAGASVGEWWETSPHVMWGLASAGASQLKHNPPTPAQRAENRRVIILVSHFRGPASAALPPTSAAVPEAVAPVWPGRVLTYPPVMRGDDVTVWQRRMHSMGFDLEVDGAYGQDSQQVCRELQAQHGLAPTGVVDEDTWLASFT